MAQPVMHVLKSSRSHLVLPAVRAHDRRRRRATLHGQCQGASRTMPLDACGDAVRRVAAGARFRPSHTAPCVRRGRADRAFRERMSRWRDAHGPWHPPRAIGTQSQMRRPLLR
jgi:hypothetical protein